MGPGKSEQDVRGGAGRIPTYPARGSGGSSPPVQAYQNRIYMKNIS